MSNAVMKNLKIDIIFAWNNSIPQNRTVFKDHMNNFCKINKEEINSINELMNEQNLEWNSYIKGYLSLWHIYVFLFIFI